MFTSIAIIALFAAVCSFAAYKISAAFWATDYSRTDKSGDGGGPRGGVFATAGGMLIALMLMIHVAPLFVAAAYLNIATPIVVVLSLVCGIVPMFKRKPTK